MYNQVWEDYEVDRTALGVTPDDVVLMITSGGCNVLNTLTESPRRIVAVDANPAQRDLLADKIRVIETGDHERLWQAFGVPAQQRRASIYTRGSYARFAWIRAFIQLVAGRGAIHRFVSSASLDDQRRVYLEEVEPSLFGPVVSAVPAALAGICGMHWRQVASTLRAGRFLIESICRAQLRRVLTTFGIRDNYYWHQLLTGAYANSVQCPRYLQPRSFDVLRRLMPRVENRHQDVREYLRNVPAGTFTKVSLLDLPEFLSPAQRLLLFREVHRVTTPGARIVFRSFAPEVGVPAACNGDSPDGLRFEADLSANLTRAERTASYGAVHVYVR
ncbi:MAG: DUF3419 family protein [Gemmatimonadaceae bacterium]